MLRTIFSIGLFAVLGLIALKFIFGIFGLAVGLFVSLLFLALKIGLVLLVVASLCFELMFIARS